MYGLKELLMMQLKLLNSMKASDLISIGCILPICQSSGTSRMSSVLIHQHSLFVHLLSHCCLTHFPHDTPHCTVMSPSVGERKTRFCLEQNLC